MEKDSGYAWVILIAATLLNTLTPAVANCLGIFMVEFVEHFEAARSTVTWVAAIQMCIGNIAGPITGSLIRRHGPRPVGIAGIILVSSGYLVSSIFPYLSVIYIFYGAATGIGLVASFMSGMVAVQLWFDKRRSLASGVYMTGYSIGGFIWPQVTRYLIDCYGWKGAMLLESALILHGIVFSAFIRPLPTKRHAHVRSENKCTKLNSSAISLEILPPICSYKDKNEAEYMLTKEDEANQCRPETTSQISRFTNCLPLNSETLTSAHVVVFLLFYVGCLLMNMGHMAVYTYLPLKGDYLDIPKDFVSRCIGIIGAIGIVARPFFGWLGDRNINITFMYGLNVFLVGVITTLSTRFTTETLILVWIVWFAIFSAGYYSIQGSVLVKVFGLDQMEMATGVLMFIFGISNMLLHTLAGLLMDRTGSTYVPFLIFGTAQTTGGILVVLVAFIQLRFNVAKKKEGNKT